MRQLISFATTTTRQRKNLKKGLGVENEVAATNIPVVIMQ